MAHMIFTQTMSKITTCYWVVSLTKPCEVKPPSPSTKKRFIENARLARGAGEHAVHQRLNPAGVLTRIYSHNNFQ